MVALGFALFLCIGLMAFWVLVFLMGVALPLWITLGSIEMLRPKRLVETADGEGEA
ncbi:hypothetical protein K6119_08370 [Paracrocinitomix mangrovi]|uniref:hypothetical protein n=1 Tax=Paracrocinitomix mangrovi TaxID=2862509 RepID=UPI001C8DB65A|nr:hypothetical protein [Paracrocinitomix mangrovi]UKN03528.1 hypothetical protein K6119_08370 [Paracrocinitomix mangrovi]